jgi:hypothetical protein
MKLRLFKLPALIISLMLFSNMIYSQPAPDERDTVRRGAIKLFLDCWSCDLNYIKEEIPYINYVRDVNEAQVYLLVTDENAGSGGSQFTYTFQGQGKFKGMNDTLVFTSSPDQTRPIIREKSTNMLKMGLMRYVARTPLSGEIDIRHNTRLKMAEVVDRWNNWVIELQTNPRFNAEETYRNLNLHNSIDISRVTKEMKFELQADQNYNRQRFIEDGNDTTYIRSSESINNLIVKSLNDHWSAGIRFEIGSSTWENYKLNTELMPALEYNLFPYSDATHRQLRFQYSAGIQYSKYNDTTFYNKMKETLYAEGIRIAYQVQEKWGYINLSLYASHYFHDFSKNTIGLNGYVNVRIFKGLSVSLNGGAGYLNNRINVEKGELTEAERLLRLKQQASNYVVWGGVSLTYTFGSIYNNVVNPRFGY